MSQTLKVPASSLRRVKVAMEKHGIFSQKSLAEALDISLYKVREFIGGRPIEAGIFIRICDWLELDWQKVTRISGTKLAEITGQEPVVAHIVPPPAARAITPLPKRSGIPRLASHLFRGNVSKEDTELDIQPEIEEPIGLSELIPEPQLIIDPKVKEMDITETETEIEEPIGQSELIPEPQLIIDPKVKEMDITEAETEIEEPIGLSELIPELVTVQVVEIIEENQALIPRIEEETEMMMLEEGNLPILEPVMPHIAPQIDWNDFIHAFHVLLSNDEWDNCGMLLRQADRGESTAGWLELYEALLPSHWQRGGRRVSDILLHGWILAQAGRLSYSQGFLSRSLDYQELALSIAKQFADRDLEHQTLKGLALLHQSLGNYQTAISYHQQYLVESADNYREQVLTMFHLGNIYFALHQYRTAIGYYTEFLSCTEVSQLLAETLKVLRNLGACQLNLKHYQESISCLQQYAEIAQELNDREKEAYASVQLGLVYAAMGLHHSALEYFEQSRAIATPLDHPTLEMQAVRGLTLSYAAQRNYKQADRLGREWLTLARILANRDEQVQAMYYLRQFNRAIA